MSTITVYYNLFLRNWQNGIATEKDLNQAIVKGYLTEEEKESIVKSEQFKIQKHDDALN